MKKYNWLSDIEISAMPTSATSCKLSLYDKFSAQNITLAVSQYSACYSLSVHDKDVVYDNGYRPS
jgi:hypothetical protein